MYLQICTFHSLSSCILRAFLVQHVKIGGRGRGRSGRGNRGGRGGGNSMMTDDSGNRRSQRQVFSDELALFSSLNHL